MRFPGSIGEKTLLAGIAEQYRHQRREACVGYVLSKYSPERIDYYRGLVGYTITYFSN